jgi:riboflavin kinase/FMN adenylyltransferase
MKVSYDLTPGQQPSAVALGNFDGLHIGHDRVIASAVEEKANGLVPTVVTFAANPLTDLGGTAGGEIITREEKIRLLKEMGVEQLYILEFAAVKDLSPEDFVAEVLEKVCRAKTVCCGFNFTFGRGGRAGSEALARLCGRRGMRTVVSPAVLIDGEPVSSTRIRSMIAEGDVDGAARLLGRPYGYRSPVRHGRRLGRELGTPTLNQSIPKDFVLPLFGVYVSRVILAGRVYAGVTNVGIKPTVGSPCALAETWMPDYHGPDFYGRVVQVDLLRFLRREMKFSGLSELKRAIIKDGEEAKAFLARNENWILYKTGGRN